MSKNPENEKKFLKDIAESKRIIASLNNLLGLKHVDTTGVVLTNSPPRKKNPDN